MPVTISELRLEHISIETDLKELEGFAYSININYPNLIHIIRRMGDFWNKHEDKEEKLFSILSNKGFPIPSKKIFFEHTKFKRHRQNIIDAINSGNEQEVKKVLQSDGLFLVREMREHMKEEDWIFYALPKHLTG
jgi:DUF438 domain-containing protein